MASREDTRFARLVSLAVHDLRTPLATISGFARTLTRMQDLGEPATRYLAMVETAAGQLGELLDELGLACRIESGRYEPTLQEGDSADLARAVADRLGADRVSVSGAGGRVRIDPVPTERAVAALAQCALRHGGLDLRERGAADKRVYRVHDRLGEPCYVCGAQIERVDYEEHTIYYCPDCQTKGRVLKDRRLSLLLR